LFNYFCIAFNNSISLCFIDIVIYRLLSFTLSLISAIKKYPYENRLKKQMLNPLSIMVIHRQDVSPFMTIFHAHLSFSGALQIELVAKQNVL